MLKASFNLPNNTLVTIEGAKEDIQDLLDYYSDSYPADSSHSAKPKARTKSSEKKSEKKIESSDVSLVSPATLTQITHSIKTCPEAEAIERNILGKGRPPEADRVLLPLYIVHEYFEDAFGLTNNEIETITKDLGRKIKVSRQNANRQFVRKEASKYVLGDKTRKTGLKIRYTLNDRGVQYMKSILEKSPPEK